MKLMYLGLLLTSAFASGRTRTLTFDRQPAGSPGKDWTIAMTHEGGAPKWEIVADSSAESRPNVLAQTSTDKTSGRFPIAVYEKEIVLNGSVGVRFKPVAGERDQAAGIVWRYQDPDNYYVVRANALENNVVLYKVEGGKRVSLSPKGTPSKTYGVKQEVPKQTWSELKVEFDGPRFIVEFNGTRIMEVEDSTFLSPGKTGLWTKADSVTFFDTVRIEKRK